MFSLALSVMLNTRAQCTRAVAGRYWQFIVCLGWSNVAALRIMQVTAIELQ